MEKIKLNAQIREVFKKKTKDLRKKGLVPAEMYGKGRENSTLSISRHDFEKILREHGTTSILLLDIDGLGTKNVLIHNLDFHPVTGLVEHIDFYEVSMTEKITTIVPLVFVGDSVAVMDLGGTLATNKNEIEVECLPGALPHNIEVDISALTDFGSNLQVSDIKIPEGVELKADPEEVIATVEAPRSEEEMAELEEPIEAPEMPAAETGEDTPPEENKE